MGTVRDSAAEHVRHFRTLGWPNLHSVLNRCCCDGSDTPRCAQHCSLVTEDVVLVRTLLLLGRVAEKKQ